MAIETIIQTNPNGSTTELKVIRGVTFGTIDFKYAKSKFGKPDEKEFGTEFFVDKATYKELKKTYKKMSLQEVENDDMQRRFHMDAPFPEQDEQSKVAMRARATRTNKNGELMELWKDDYMNLDVRPKVYNKATGENITSQFYLQSGCVGDIYWTETNHKDFGLLSYIRKIELDVVIPYVKEEQPTA